MGWKASCIFVSWGGAESFTGSPPNNTVRAIEIAQQLGYNNYLPVDGTNMLDDVIYPRNKAVYIGVYAAGLIIVDEHLSSRLIIQDKAHKAARQDSVIAQDRARLLALYPQAKILSIMLHSVVNLWGFAWYEHSALVRASWGASDDGLMLDFGAPLTEEMAFRQQPDWQELIGAEGEELCFSERMLGQRLDSFPLEQLQLQKFEPVKKRSWPLSLFMKA